MGSSDLKTGIILLIIGLILIATGIIGRIAKKYCDYSKRFRYLNMEIKRADKKEKRYWKRQKRHLLGKMLIFKD